MNDETFGGGLEVDDQDDKKLADFFTSVGGLDDDDDLLNDDTFGDLGGDTFENLPDFFKTMSSGDDALGGLQDKPLESDNNNDQDAFIGFKSKSSSLNTLPSVSKKTSSSTAEEAKKINATSLYSDDILSKMVLPTDQFQKINSIEGIVPNMPVSLEDLEQQFEEKVTFSGDKRKGKGHVSLEELENSIVKDNNHPQTHGAPPPHTHTPRSKLSRPTLYNRMLNL